MSNLITNAEECRICGSHEFKPACFKNGYKYVTCPTCDVTRQYPYPDKQETDEFYKQYLKIKNDENPIYMSEDSWTSFKMSKNLTLDEIGIRDTDFINKKILDIGCATGLFVRYINERGGDAFGIDISAELVDIAKSKGLNCECKSLFEVNSKYDVINLSHVIEHVDDPLKYFSHIYSLLRPNGYFIIETPCTGIISESFGEAWRFYMPVEHIHLFSQQSLFKQLGAMNFSILNWVRFGSGNTTGAIPSTNKKVSDIIAKRLGIGDTISILSKKS